MEESKGHFVNSKRAWENQLKHRNTKQILQDHASAEQKAIEQYAEQLKNLDATDKKNKQKIGSLKKKIERKKESRDQYLSQIRELEDYDFWLEKQLLAQRLKWSIDECDCMDSPIGEGKTGEVDENGL